MQLARVWKKIEAPASGAQLETHGVAVIAIQPATAELANLADLATAAADGTDPVDASLLCWAAHFIVEQAWSQLGTTATREILRRTRAELLRENPVLVGFVVTEEAHVAGSLDAGARLPRAAVRQLAAWMTAFRLAAAQVAPEVRATSVRACTALMADALRQAGFYDACDVAEGAAAGRAS